MKREKFGSRLGFILISAGCAIGLGNVWRFPYITGKYGGAAFVLIYLLFLVLLGLPIMVMEFAVGRGSQASIALSFDRLEPLGTKWHWYKWFGIGGNYLLMMFYTTIGGWLLLYTGKMAIGEFKGLDADGVTGVFYITSWTACYNDNLYDPCCCAVLWNRLYGTSERCGADYKENDDPPFRVDDHSCSAFRDIAGSRERTGVLSSS